VSAATTVPPAAEERASPTTWIALVGCMLGALMAVLNIQITNASLTDIEGGIGTGVDNGAWISTAYLIGEIIVIPLTDYLSRVFSFRLFLLVNTALFLVFSAACAFAENLTQMIVLRGFQGFCGGVMIPMAFTFALTRLPKSQQPIGIAIFAITATFAPAIGPTIGGYLTETYGWQTIFFVNMVPGAAMLTMLFFTLESAPVRLGLLKEGDWLGIACMAIGLASFQTVLEEGNLHDWFGSTMIVRLSIAAAVFLTAFVVIELRSKNPAVNLRLLGRRNFGFGTLANILVGFALYGSVYVLPQYLATVQGYNAEQIGMVLAWVGLPQLLIIPFVPKLMARVDARGLVVVGLAIFAASCFMNIYMSLDYAGPQLMWSNIVRALGQAVVLTPLTAIAMVGIGRDEAAAASGVFNMLRNLGGAIGTAALATVITKREQFHSNIIGQSVTEYGVVARERIGDLQHYFQAHGIADAALAHHRAVVALGDEVARQALVMAFSDTFYVLGVVMLIAAAAVLLTRGGTSSGAPAH
jgi:DHA2 family multidrug resistance protein